MTEGVERMKDKLSADDLETADELMLVMPKKPPLD